MDEQIPSFSIWRIFFFSEKKFQEAKAGKVHKSLIRQVWIPGIGGGWSECWMGGGSAVTLLGTTVTYPHPPPHPRYV